MPSKTNTSASSAGSAQAMPLASNNIALAVVAVVLFVSGFFLGQLWQENKMLKSGAAPTAAQPAVDPNAAAPAGPDQATLANMPAVTDDDYAKGASNPVVTLVEYSDFECPFCNRFHPTMTQVMENYGDQVRWVYRHLPLSFHPFAQKAGEAAECVGAQLGQTGFWAFTDELYAQQAAGETMSDDLITAAATTAGVNMATFQTCLDNGEMTQKVLDSAAGAQSAGVNGTPGTIVVTSDGPQELIPGALPYESVEQIIQQYL